MTFDEYGHFGEAVNNYEDGIESARSWKLRDEIHRKRVPRLRWNGKWLEQSLLFMPRGFIALALIASRDILSNLFRLSRPIEVMGHKLLGFVLTVVTGQGRVMTQ